MSVLNHSQPPFYAFDGGVLVIRFDQVRSMHLVSWFPSVIAFWVPLPLYQILEPSRLAMTSVVLDLFHFILLFPPNEVRWGTGEVWPMDGVFMIGR